MFKDFGTKQWNAHWGWLLLCTAIFALLVSNIASSGVRGDFSHAIVNVFISIAYVCFMFDCAMTIREPDQYKWMVSYMFEEREGRVLLTMRDIQLSEKRIDQLEGFLTERLRDDNIKSEDSRLIIRSVTKLERVT